MTGALLYQKLQNHLSYSNAQNKKQNTLKVNAVVYSGVRLDHFERQEPFNLGRGGFSNVKCYKHTGSGVVMAVKQLRNSMNEETSPKNPSIRDIVHLTAAQGNSHIVTLFGSFDALGETYICMDKLATCFAKILDKIGPLSREIPTKVVAMVCYSVSDALCFLKQRNIIHRDIKPANILLSVDGVIKLSDFGGSGLLYNSLCLSDPTMTTQYAAPERISPENAGISCVSDVWSLGISAYELATKENPYTNTGRAYDILDQIVQQEPPVLSTSAPGYHPRLADFISRCLKRNPKHRMYPKPGKDKYFYIMKHQFILPENLAGPEFVQQWFESLDLK